MLVRAACMLVINSVGTILQVSRRDNHTDWGLPGGGREEGESPLQTAIRELWEETQVRVQEKDCLLLHTGEEPRTRAIVATFLALEYDAREMGAVSDEGLVRWGGYRALLEGSFGQYNAQLLLRLKAIKNLLLPVTSI